KEGIALRACNQQPGERRQAGVVPDKGLQEFIGTGGRQRIKRQLRVEGFTAPGVLILGSVVDQEQEPGRRQDLDQAIEQGLGFGIDPVQILEYQQQRLHLAFAQQQTLERRQRALAPLRWIKLQEGAVLWQGVQQRQQRRHRVLKRCVERQHLSPDLGPKGP